MKRYLGAFERALLISDRYAPFNIVCALHIEGMLSPQILYESLSLLQARQPLLRSRIIQSDGRPCFDEMDHIDVPLQVIDRQGEIHWKDIVEREINQRIDIAAGPLFRCFYLPGGLEGSSRGEIIMTFHHSVADAASITNLFNELLKTCAAIHEKGQSDPLLELSVCPPIEDLFPAGFKGAGRLWRTLVYVSRQGIDEIRYRWLARGKRTPPVMETGLAQILSMTTPPALVDALVQRARRERVTLNSVLNAAMMIALNQHLYAGEETPMRTFSFADLRPYVVPPLSSENMSNAISMLRYTVLVDPDRDLWDIARVLHVQIYQSLKYGDKFIASLVSEQLMKAITKLHTFRMGSTGLSYSGAVDLLESYGPYVVLGLNGFVSNIDLGPEYSAMVSLFNNELSWGIVYLDGDMDRHMAQSIANGIHNVLEAAL